MLEQLDKKKHRVAGVRQVMKGIREGSLSRIFLALDAPSQLQGQIRQAANERQLDVETVSSMEELGQMCAIEVPCAVAGLCRRDTSSF